MHVSALSIFPVKSLRGHAPERATVEPHGLRHDRRWMVVDDDGHKFRLDRLPRMLAVTATPREDGGVVLSAGSLPPLEVGVPHSGERVPVGLSRVGTAVLAAPDAHEWLTEVLGQPARLVWFDDPSRRSVSESHGGMPGDTLSLADTGPLLLTSMASLRRLDQWGAQAFAERYASCAVDAGSRPTPLAMERFRPNLVVDGDLEPFAEDSWTHVQVGDVTFRTSELCDRCPIPGLDPETQAMTREPLRSLARHRRRDGSTWFGIRLVPLGSGTIAVGDEVTATTSPAAGRTG